MTCKDCIHYEICTFDSIIGKTMEKDCKRFKNRTNFVEVVRCEDCIYNEIGSCTHSQKYDEDNYRADYFCADGTPKERSEENA